MNVLGNYSQDRMEIYQKAIKEAGLEKILWIKEQATHRNGDIMTGFFSLMYNRSQSPDLENFWKIINRLSSENVADANVNL